MAIQGAERVNDELEVGYDARFEGRWHYAELIGRLFMFLVLVAALCGFLGRGPFSHRTITNGIGRLAVDYEPVARFGTATQITLHIHQVAADQQKVILSSTFLEPFGLSQIYPQPVAELPNGGGLTLEFATPAHPGDAEIRFQVTPSQVGPVHLSLQVGDGERLQWSQFVLP